jgi:hypothetical protein
VIVVRSSLHTQRDSKPQTIFIEVLSLDNALSNSLLIYTTKSFNGEVQSLFGTAKKLRVLKQ